MEKEELNKCLRKFYMFVRKQDGLYYNKVMFILIRVVIDRYLCNELNSKLFLIIGDSEFIEVNKVFNFLLKFLSKLGEICFMVYKFVLIVEVVVKFYEVGELVDVSSFDLKKL